MLAFHRRVCLVEQCLWLWAWLLVWFFFFLSTCWGNIAFPLSPLMLMLVLCDRAVHIKRQECLLLAKHEVIAKNSVQ